MFLLYLCVLTRILTHVNSQGDCSNSVTVASTGPTCPNQVIFEENFNDFNIGKWKNEIRISGPKEEEFVIYDKKRENMFIKNGKLFIQPTLLPADIVEYGAIDLKACTGVYQTTDCSIKSVSYNIIPPIYSAKIEMRDFHFTYGVVEIRAKLPSGDWIYPQLWLEPKFNEYGPNLNSGRMIIASARGNKELKMANGKEIGNKVLKAGIALGVDEKVYGKSVLYERDNGLWSDDFHNFTFVWKPNSLETIVDGIQKELINPTSQAISSGFNFSEGERKQSLWSTSSPQAPFDKSFHLVLGVGVGGKREFPDGSFTGNLHKKPWKNIGKIKQLLSFWVDRNTWYPTWKGGETALQIDYVKVTAV